MTQDQEHWAEAVLVSKLHGQLAQLHVAARIDAQAKLDNAEGVSRWTKIAAQLAHLQKADAESSHQGAQSFAQTELGATG